MMMTAIFEGSECIYVVQDVDRCGSLMISTAAKVVMSNASRTGAKHWVLEIAHCLTMLDQTWYAKGSGEDTQ